MSSIRSPGSVEAGSTLPWTSAFTDDLPSCGHVANTRRYVLLGHRNRDRLTVRPIADFTFPFGRLVRPVAPAADGERRVFVLGVYPSAVHPRCVGADGTEAIKAVAIDNEPEPFWTGGDASARVEAVNAELPEGVGRLEAANQNGPSGLTLAERYLTPLWIGPWRVLDHRRGEPMAGQHGSGRSPQTLVPATCQPGPAPGIHAPRPKEIGLVADRVPTLRSEWDAATPEVLVTLGAEPAKALGLDGPTHTDYGQPTSVTMWDRSVVHLALVHPRQAGGLGDHSSDWAATHQAWIESSPAL